MRSDQIKHETTGFKITNIHGDDEFNITALEDFLQQIILHIYPKDEHVDVIEKEIITFKE